MATKPSKGNGEQKPGPKPVEETPEVDREVIKDAKNRLDILYQKRASSVNSLQKTIALAKQSEQQSFVLRGRISVFEEEIDTIKKRYGLKDPVQ